MKAGFTCDAVREDSDIIQCPPTHTHTPFPTTSIYQFYCTLFTLNLKSPLSAPTKSIYTIYKTAIWAQHDQAQHLRRTHQY